MPASTQPAYRCRKDGTRMFSTLNCDLLRERYSLISQLPVALENPCQDCPGPEKRHECLGCGAEVFTDGEAPLGWVERGKGYLCSNCNRARDKSSPAAPAGPPKPAPDESPSACPPQGGRPRPGAAG